MQEDLTEKEREQLLKLVALQKTAGIVMRNWVWTLAGVFAVLAASFSLFLVFHYARSGSRFSATAQLLYSPRQIARIQNVSDKQLMSVLERNSIKRKVGARLGLAPEERERLGFDLEIRQERNLSNLFTLTAHSPSWKGAVQKVNAFADVLIDSYVDYRMHDLDVWKESIAIRKKTLQDQISSLESEENVLKAKAGVVSPVEMLTMTTTLLSDQRRNHSLLDAQIAGEELKRKKLEGDVGGLGDVLTANAAYIRRKSEEIAAIDREISKLREVYTDINPKVTGKLDERKALLDEYTAFLKDKGLEGIDIDTIDRIEKSAGELSETALRIAGLKENLGLLEQEIKANEKRASELTALIPAFDRLRLRRADLEETLRGIEEQLEHIGYLQMTVRNDLQQVERSGDSSDRNPLAIKNFALAVAGAALCTLCLAFWIVALGILFGKVSGGEELKIDDKVVFLGSLPRPGEMKEADEHDVLGVVSLRFVNADLPKGIVLVCRLPGAAGQPKFREVLGWSLAMAGSQTFRLEIVANADFAPPDGASAMLNAHFKGDKGWFPVGNRYALAPTELQMLQADLATLRERYDHVFIHMPDGIRRGGSFFDQVLGVCDSVLLVVGANVTPRSWLAYAKRHVQSADRPMMALVAGAKNAVVLAEMETRK